MSYRCPYLNLSLSLRSLRQCTAKTADLPEGAQTVRCAALQMSLYAFWGDDAMHTTWQPGAGHDQVI